MDGLRDRSSRPLSWDSQTPLATCDAIEFLRQQRHTRKQIAAPASRIIRAGLYLSLSRAWDVAFTFTSAIGAEGHPHFNEPLSYLARFQRADCHRRDGGIAVAALVVNLRAALPKFTSNPRMAADENKAIVTGSGGPKLHNAV